VDFVYTDHDTTSDLGFRRSPIRKPAFSPELLQIVNYVNHLVVVRKSCLDRCEGAFADGTSGSQDWDLCLRLVEAARKVSHVPAVLYHWRGRPGSVAADTDAKPWVHEACLATRRRHLEDIDGRLQLAREQSQHRYHYEPDLRRDGELPAVRVMMATATGAESYPAEPAYAGPTQTVALAIAKESTNGDVLDRLRTACNDSASDDGLVWLIDGRRRIPEGELERLAAFAIQPGVGAVWPFRSALARLCYTRHPSADRLAQLARVSNAFTRFSGNVLTGPFHGLLVRTRALRQALVRLEETGPDARAIAEFRRRTADLDAVGASIGLALIASGLRNVSCRGMMCDIDLEDAVPPDGWLPDADPWL
jgi:hypothetical protein